MKLQFVLVLCLFCPFLSRAGVASKSSRIQDYFRANNQSYVLFPLEEAGSRVVGKTFHVYRTKDRSGVGTQVRTGTIKVVSTSGQNALAVILEDKSNDKLAGLISYSQVMIGDVVSEARLAIDKKLDVLPTLSFRYEELFVDPKANPASYELSPEGKDKLREVHRTLAKARISGIVIEGHTDPKGKSDVNQVESHQRALVVKQVMAEEFEFDEGRMLAVGYGEAELAENSLTNGSAEVNRRIVIKPLSFGKLGKIAQ